MSEVSNLPELADASPSLAPALSLDRRSVRPGSVADIPLVLKRLREAIAASPLYNEQFKAYELQRFNARFLRALIEADPWYVAIGMVDGTPAGAVIMIPQFGNIWCPWIFTFPEFAETAIGLATIRTMIRHWDHGRFHNIYSLARSENRAPLVILKRLGFREVARLDNHLFGEDYIQLERRLTKTTPGYDTGIAFSRIDRVRGAVRSLLRT